MAREWERVKPMLQTSVQAFQLIEFNKMTKLEAARWITGQALEEKDWEGTLASAEQVIFVPNAHVGPYLGTFKSGKILWLLFGARLPKGAQIEAPELSVNEILVRLSALNDEQRLRILKYISERGELRSNDIIQNLGLSQSAASRHLKQLSATGYLSERRCDGAKCYALIPERIEDSLQAIRAFLLENQEAGL
jgi:ArsR family transcriptional regulator